MRTHSLHSLSPPHNFTLLPCQKTPQFTASKIIISLTQWWYISFSFFIFIERYRFKLYKKYLKKINSRVNRNSYIEKRKLEFILFLQFQCSGINVIPRREESAIISNGKVKRYYFNLNWRVKTNRLDQFYFKKKVNWLLNK